MKKEFSIKASKMILDGILMEADVHLRADSRSSAKKKFHKKYPGYLIIEIKKK